MTLVLVVAYQTAGTSELVDALLARARRDPDAEFQLLVPATPVQYLRGDRAKSGGDERAFAREAGDEATYNLRAAGLPVREPHVGFESPLDAIENELQFHPGEYDEIVIATFPSGMSRWLHQDVIHQAQKRFDLPVSHVVAKVPSSSPAPTSLDEAKAEAIRRVGDAGVIPPV
jgi:hypothetical protein